MREFGGTVWLGFKLGLLESTEGCTGILRRGSQAPRNLSIAGCSRSFPSRCALELGAPKPSTPAGKM